MREPTTKECEEQTIVDGMVAAFYPQMGGYVGKCLVEPEPVNNGKDYCFNVYVWHDGEFPFSNGKPRELHHCNAQQFKDFGYLLDLLEHNLRCGAKI